MLAPEGLQEIFERHGWWSRPPAMALWALLGASLALILFGKFLDTKFQRAGPLAGRVLPDGTASDEVLLSWLSLHAGLAGLRSKASFK